MDLFPLPVIKITDLEKALHGIDNLKSCRFYYRDEAYRTTYVYDRLLGYVGQQSPVNELDVW